LIPDDAVNSSRLPTVRVAIINGESAEILREDMVLSHDTQLFQFLNAQCPHIKGVHIRFCIDGIRVVNDPEQRWYVSKFLKSFLPFIRHRYGFGLTLEYSPTMMESSEADEKDLLYDEAMITGMLFGMAATENFASKVIDDENESWHRARMARFVVIKFHQRG
jgi:hypothetical protein